MRGYSLEKMKHVGLVLILSVLIGLSVGALDAGFGRVLDYISIFFHQHKHILLPFLGFAGMLFVHIQLKYGKDSHLGIGLIFKAGYGEVSKVPKRLVPFAICGTWLTHLFGGSAGREGVAVQIGATVAHAFGRQFQGMNYKRFIVIGMASGFAGLFQTPIAAIFFAMEVLVVGHLTYDVLLPTMVASFTASFTSEFLGLSKFSYHLVLDDRLPWFLIVRLVILGIIFGLVGYLFARTMRLTRLTLTNHFPNPVWRIGIVGIIVSILLFIFHDGRYASLGTNLIVDSFHGGTIYPYDWLLKMILTALTLACGFQGGEVLPMFAIGSTLGAALAGIFALPVDFVAALGFASVFGSATNTFLAPIFIGAEVFGFDAIPYFFIVCAIGYLCNGNRSIYSLQKIEKEF
ncbi:chloride channel protein [Enterococcus cecorum]|nr:chloride channel protein [Enterococcus cecorum]CAI3283371.1 chloride channel protein [Enterococcus cecorum]CAI3307833.1 chloride channel protein [Enterococcus cecorum]CAI3340865.1 chloride channel protein [Enterococcus cecorum]CAI3344888.1 chloride channel protein [Enterococcus cecorum]